MSEPIHSVIKRSLLAADGLYYRLVLLVGKSGSGKTTALRALAESMGSAVINVNLNLSASLLELNAKQRVLRLPELLARMTDDVKPPVIFDNLEILFGRDLRQDPLRLLQGLSRNRSVVASWNGTASGGKLLYAETGHPEYRCYDSVDALIVTMDGTATDLKSFKGTVQE